MTFASGATLSQGNIATHSRELSFYYAHMGKRLSVVYWQDGQNVVPAIASTSMTVFDLIYDVRDSLRRRGSYQVVSA